MKLKCPQLSFLPMRQPVLIGETQTPLDLTFFLSESMMDNARLRMGNATSA